MKTIATLRFQSPRNRVKCSVLFITYHKPANPNLFQSPRNRVKCSVLLKSWKWRRRYTSFNPLEIGSSVLCQQGGVQR